MIVADLSLHKNPSQMTPVSHISIGSAVTITRIVKAPLAVTMVTDIPPLPLGSLPQRCRPSSTVAWPSMDVGGGVG